jgi:hypothetical protein
VEHFGRFPVAFTSRMIACYTPAMSRPMKKFLMQYVRRALLLLADGIKVLCEEEDEISE